MFYKKINNRGFTLVELIISIAIIAILISIITTVLFSARKESRDLTRVNDVQQLSLAVHLYREANGGYPDYADGIVIGVGNTIDTDLAPYLGGIDPDPLSSGAFSYMYDSEYDCGGTDFPVVIATRMEDEKNSNLEEECGDTGLSYISVLTDSFSPAPD